MQKGGAALRSLSVWNQCGFSASAVVEHEPTTAMEAWSQRTRCLQSSRQSDAPARAPVCVSVSLCLVRGPLSIEGRVRESSTSLGCGL